MSEEYQIRGAWSRKMSEGPGGFAMWVPSQFSGSLNIMGQIPNTDLHKVEGNVVFNNDFVEPFRHQDLVGVCSYDDGRLKGITLIGLTKDFSPAILSLPFKLDEPPTYNLGTTIDDIPRNAKTMYIFTGKLMEWKRAVGKYDETLKDELRTESGLLKGYSQVEEAIKKEMEEAKEAQEKRRVSDEHKTDLDAIVFQ